MTLTIGAPRTEENDDRPGYVKVYHMEGNGSSWKQINSNIDGTKISDRFATPVSLSADGKMRVIGAPGYWAKGDIPGYVRVYYIKGVVLVRSGNSSARISMVMVLEYLYIYL